MSSSHGKSPRSLALYSDSCSRSSVVSLWLRMITRMQLNESTISPTCSPLTALKSCVTLTCANKLVLSWSAFWRSATLSCNAWSHSRQSTTASFVSSRSRKKIFTLSMHALLVDLLVRCSARRSVRQLPDACRVRLTTSQTSAASTRFLYAI